MSKPIGERVLIKRDVAPEVTESGIFTGKVATKLNSGVIVATGDECKYVKEGESVIFVQNSGSVVQIDGEELLCMPEGAILIKLSSF